MQWEENRTNFDRNLAVVIGIDRYNSNGIHDLKTAVGDAIAIADLLEKEYAYKKTDIIQLLDGEATLTGLKDLLSDTIPNQLKPTSCDRLIFYYAGHGIPRNSKDGPAGYLVPQDADLNNADSFLSMQYVYEQLSQLSCHHLLVILDCCFAGTFQWAGSRKLISILETVRREHYDRFIRFPAWQVITSSAHDQEAMDVALDNTVLAEDNRGTVTNSSHSPFALALIEGLKDNRADLIPDGVVTAHELYLYLEQRVSELSKERQKPGLYPLRREYDRGEFIFTKPGFTRDQLDPAPPLDENNNPYRGLKSFDEKHAGFFFGRQSLIEELAKRLLVPNHPLAVVLGVSGSGKSSLVKAGLISYLRDKQAKQWHILEPMRPGELPFTSLARVLLPVVNANLLEQLSQVSFLDEAVKRVIESKAEADQGFGRADQAKPDGDRPFQINETLIKVAQSWGSATPEARLLLIEDYLAQLETLCRPEEQQLLVRLHDEILARLASLLGHLQQDPQYLVAAIKTWSQNHPDIKLLLVIDQFEELITASHEAQADSREDDETGGDVYDGLRLRTTEPKQWQAFLEMLRGAIAACPHLWRVVLTLRSDFEPRFLDSPLKSYWKDARFPVRAMNSDELRQAIEGPALKQALYFEPPELVGKLIDEVGQMPGALPLLSFTLSELYIKLHGRWVKDNASDRALRIKDYEELGGVAGALTRRATQEYDNLLRDFGELLGKAYQATMRRVMLRMVTIEGGGVARRRVLESELVYPNPQENERVRLVSDRLIKARLLVKGQEIGEPYVETVHDFLVRGWNELQEWIKDNLENLVLQERLTPAAKDWERNNYIVGLLLPDGDRLNQLEVFLQHFNNWFNEIEKQFVETSIERREVLRRQAEALQVTSELEAQSTKVSDLLFLSMQPLEALVLAIHSMGKNLRKLPEKKLDSVVQSLNRATEIAREQNVIYGHEETVCCVAYSPDGKTIISGGHDVRLRLWDLQGDPVNPDNFSFNYNEIPFTTHEEWVLDLITESFAEEMGIPSKRGEKRTIWSVAYSPDGNSVAAASYDGKIYLWNLQGNPIGKPFEGHEGDVFSVAFSPDGQLLVSGGADRTIRLWNLEGNPIGKPFKRHEGDVFSVAFSPNGELVVSGSIDKTVQLWNLEGDPVGEPLYGHTEKVLSVVFDRSGRFIVSGSADKTVRLWDLSARKSLPKRNWSYSWLTKVNLWLSSSVGKGFKSDGDSVSLIEKVNPLRYDLNFDEIFEGHESDVTSVACSPVGRMIASGSRDGIIHLWYPSRNLSKHFSLSLFGHKSSVKSVAFSPDGKSVTSCGEDKSIRIWSLEKIPFGGHLGMVLAVAISPNSRYILSSGAIDSCLMLRDIEGNLISKPFQGHESHIWAVAFSPDGKFISSAGNDKTIRLWDLQGNLIGKPFQGHNDAIMSIKFTPDSKSIISGGEDGMIYIWDLQGNRTSEIFAQNSRIASIDIDPDGKFIISGGANRTLLLWDLKNHSLIRKIKGHEDEIYFVIFSPDGRLIASCGKDETIRLWDLQGNSLGEPIKGHIGKVTSVVFSPDGQLIASCGEDKTIRLWDLQGNSIHLYQGHNDEVWSIAFSPNGKFIVSGSHDQTVRLWHIDYNSLLVDACTRLRHHPVLKNPLTEIEKGACETCQEYVWSKLDSKSTL